MRVTFQLNSIMMGGMENHAGDLARELACRGHEVSVIVPELKVLRPLVERLEASAIPVYRLSLPGDQPLGYLMADFWRMRKLYRRIMPDVVHQHRTGPYHGKWACLAAWAAGVPVVVATEHQSAYRLRGLEGWQNRIADQILDRVITVSEADRQKQIAVSGRAPEKIVTIYNGIPFRERPISLPAHKQETRRALDLSPNAPVIGTVSRLDEQKGIKFLLRATSCLLATYPDLVTLIIGDGPDRARLEAEARELGVAQQVRFLGYQPEAAMLISAMDVFVLASLWESFGLVLVEAMAAAVPVVASSVGGIPEVVVHGETGLLTPSADVNALAGAVRRYLSDPALRRQAGAAGRARALRLFTVQSMADKIVALYIELLRSHGIK